MKITSKQKYTLYISIILIILLVLLLHEFLNYNNTTKQINDRNIKIYNEYNTN